MPAAQWVFSTCRMLPLFIFIDSKTPPGIKNSRCQIRDEKEKFVTLEKEVKHRWILPHSLPYYHLKLCHLPKEEILKRWPGKACIRSMTLTCSTLQEMRGETKQMCLSLKETSQSTFNPVAKLHKRLEKSFEELQEHSQIWKWVWGQGWDRGGPRAAPSETCPRPAPPSCRGSCIRQSKRKLSCKRDSLRKPGIWDSDSIHPAKSFPQVLGLRGNDSVLSLIMWMQQASGVRPGTAQSEPGLEAAPEKKPCIWQCGMK